MPNTNTADQSPMLGNQGEPGSKERSPMLGGVSLLSEPQKRELLFEADRALLDSVTQLRNAHNQRVIVSSNLFHDLSTQIQAIRNLVATPYFSESTVRMTTISSDLGSVIDLLGAIVQEYPDEALPLILECLRVAIETSRFVTNSHALIADIIPELDNLFSLHSYRSDRYETIENQYIKQQCWQQEKEMILTGFSILKQLSHGSVAIYGTVRPNNLPNHPNQEVELEIFMKMMGALAEQYVLHRQPGTLSEIVEELMEVEVHLAQISQLELLLRDSLQPLLSVPTARRALTAVLRDVEFRRRSQVFREVLIGPLVIHILRRIHELYGADKIGEKSDE